MSISTPKLIMIAQNLAGILQHQHHHDACIILLYLLYEYNALNNLLLNVTLKYV